MVSMTTEFKPFKKMPRLYKTVSVSEKIDGTNASLLVEGGKVVAAGSRTRWLTTGNDNFGFCNWVTTNKDLLDALELKDGHHFGEWWGLGIQRGYNQFGRFFSFFNPLILNGESFLIGGVCVNTVPVMYHGVFSDYQITTAMRNLAVYGSQAAPGYMKPEGIVVYHEQYGDMFKVTFEDNHKWETM